MSDRLEKWAPRVYRSALRLTTDPHTADDLTQETMLRAWRRRDWLRDPQAVRVWLFRITANLWRDRIRRNRSPIARPDPLDDVRAAREAGPHRQLIGEEDLSRALRSLDSLPDRQRQVLYLHACEDFSASEIADVLGISPEAVRSNLSAARARMRELLPEMYPVTARTERTS